MYIAFHVLAIFCIIASIISSFKLPHWSVKVWDIGRLHLAWVISALWIFGVVYMPLNQWWVITYLIILMGSIIFHLRIIFPFTPFHSVEVLPTTNRGEHSVKVLTVNVRSKNDQYQRLIDLVEKINPDILLLTEVNQAWADAISGFKKPYPHSIIHPQENTYGMTLFSKFPLKKSEIKFLVEDDIPSFHTTIDLHGKDIQFLALHPRPPAPSNDTELKNIELIKVAGMSNINELPTIVGGDLNDVGWSRITKRFKKESGLKDPRIGRGFFNTYNALIPIFRFPIDHFFLSEEFKLLNIKRLSKIGSDHFPVLLEVNLED